MNDLPGQKPLWQEPPAKPPHFAVRKRPTPFKAKGCKPRPWSVICRKTGVELNTALNLMEANHYLMNYEEKLDQGYGCPACTRQVKPTKERPRQRLDPDTPPHLEVISPIGEDGRSGKVFQARCTATGQTVSQHKTKIAAEEWVYLNDSAEKCGACRQRAGQATEGSYEVGGP